MAIVFSSKISDSTNEHTISNYYTGMFPLFSTFLSSREAVKGIMMKMKIS